MKVAILAAGEGSRLRSEGVSVPKGLVKLNGIPLIERIIRIAEKNGASSINCIVNEESHELSDYIRNMEIKPELNLVIKSTSGSLQSLFEIRHLLKNDDVCLFTVDTVFNENEFCNYLEYSKQQTEYDAVFAVTDFIDDEKPLYIKTDKNEQITEFADKTDAPESVSGGIYYLTPKVVDLLEVCFTSGKKRLRSFQRMILENNYSIKAYKFSKIIDIDHVSDLNKAKEFVAQTN